MGEEERETGHIFYLDFSKTVTATVTGILHVDDAHKNVFNRVVLFSSKPHKKVNSVQPRLEL